MPGIGVAVGSDGLTKTCIIPVRIAGDDIQIGGKLAPYLFLQSEGIDIGAIADDILLAHVIITCDLFQIASVKFRLLFHIYTSYSYIFEILYFRHCHYL